MGSLPRAHKTLTRRTEVVEVACYSGAPKIDCGNALAYPILISASSIINCCFIEISGIEKFDFNN